MARFYIDFDSTLYDTDRIRNFDREIALSLTKYVGLSFEDSVKKVQQTHKIKKKVFDICDALEEEYQVNKGLLRESVEQFLAEGKKFIFNDAIDFLKRLVSKGHEINILTFTDKEFDYQMLKLKGSGVLQFVDNVIICSKDKGKLGLDYENAIFIDDNPSALKSLYLAGVSEKRLIRMRRAGAGYSSIEIDDFPVTEVKSFDEIDNF